MILSKVFNIIGLIGLVVLMLLIYINKIAPEDFFLREYKMTLILGLAIIITSHYIYLGTCAFKQKQWWWVGLLFLAPVPTYWFYFLWEYSKPFFKSTFIKLPE